MSDRVRRSCALSPTELLRLDLWAAAFTAGEGFGMFSPMLVGSTMTGTTYRDVDVRVILDDDDPVLADPNRLRLFHVAISVWAQQTTGLPIDFQFQSNTENQTEHGDKPRNPLGSRWRTALSSGCTPEDGEQE